MKEPLPGNSARGITSRRFRKISQWLGDDGRRIPSTSRPSSDLERPMLQMNNGNDAATFLGWGRWGSVSSATRQWWLWVPLANLASMVKDVGPPQLEGVLYSYPSLTRPKTVPDTRWFNPAHVFFLERFFMAWIPWLVLWISMDIPNILPSFLRWFASEKIPLGWLGWLGWLLSPRPIFQMDISQNLTIFPEQWSIYIVIWRHYSLMVRSHENLPRMCLYMCLYVFICVCMCLYVFIFQHSGQSTIWRIH